MKRKYVLCFLWTLLVLHTDYTFGEANPANLPASDLSQLHNFQNADPADQRPRLSVQQQAHILSDVQQHQQQYTDTETDSPSVNPYSTSSLSDLPTPPTTSYASLSKYKVDRAKQQYQLQQQLHRLQQRIYQQQQHLNQQLSKSYLDTAQSQYTPIIKSNQYQQPRFNSQYQSLSPNYVRDDLNQPFFSDQQTLQLQNYFEQQRQLEILQRQREQLLLQQQDLRRQQELLKLEQLQRLAAATSTTTTTTTTLPPTTNPPITSTNSPLLLSSPTARRITPAESELFLKAIATHQKKFTSSSPSTTQKPSSGKTRQERVRLIDSENLNQDALLSLLQGQSEKGKSQVKFIYQDQQQPNSDRDALLRQLKQVLSKSNELEDERNVTTREIVLSNGKKVRVINAGGSPSSVTTIKPPKAILEELTKGVLPPGADFEVIRHKEDGKLEEVGKIPLSSLPAKKVTFVVLEEQSDGSYKIQGVKGNAEKESTVDVQSIVDRIKKGELKLPPSSLNPSTSLPVSHSTRHATNQPNNPTTTSTNKFETSYASTERPRYSTTSYRRSSSKSSTENIPHVTVSPNSVSSTDKPNSYSNTGRTPFVPTILPTPTINGVSGGSTTERSFSTTYNKQHASQSTATVASSPTPRSISSTAKSISPSTLSGNIIHQDSYERSTSLPATVIAPSSPPSSPESLNVLLRREGLFAMAKYLRQSGLDNVLNETGPYTIFVPTDKAFRTLLVQLGGPEKADQKFKDNPRLLSGLLLHHVIPGAFKINTLLDEMTGVSLAGTQLRVNVYSMHDHEWNDVKVTTINGARVAPNKRDIEIPQGIAHAIDRVMFPLPVGDLMQTLQADRERRFTTFIKLLHSSGLDEMLSGPKTYTVFAPTDAAFAEAVTKTGSALWRESDGPDAAKEIVTRHIIPTTLYTAGMRFYHQKETLREKTPPIHIQKTGGRIRVNEAHMITYNVPATNGVLHAIDTVL
ncbi:ras guanine nucleotide exchange factor R isoform X2 [Leptopilina heterotoma]|uniref:ras guanine nucleotide exchange factor R isoform X2 n=1 Tax=Leptopilina heterotoma TaxID=63436 RepID=UPI001CA881FE|nr:ras guanine nucleotide exchange factor R isoform X2 [Leptopilina heterotoma]